jgi:hypothetical protein
MGDEMSVEEKLMAELDARLVRALEARPMVTIPEGFAARVVAQVPARREGVRLAVRGDVALTPRHYGRNAMVTCMVVLGVALLVAFSMNGVAVPMMVQVTVWILYAQFLGLVVWFGVRGGLRRLG